jgi:hypothetical protein
MQFQDSSAHNLQMLPLKLTTHHLPAPLGDSIRLSCLNIGEFNLQHYYKLI